MLFRNGPSMQVGKYFSCLLNNAVPNDDIIVTSVQHSTQNSSRHSSDSSMASSVVSLCALCTCAGWRWTFWTLFL